ncbi:nucleoid-associated protein [Leptolyngbya sp. AN03gr2]|uniref:nucleoid-associated protein n=1 Tax=unclassified Leptolyngbya TaxID=2650499 RepID=UPI003D319CF7
MRIDLGRLNIERLIVHEIPEKQSDSLPYLSLSEVESTLTQAHKNLFSQKLSGSLSASAFDVVLDATSESPIPKQIFKNLEDSDDNFVDMSIKMAQRLYDSQTGINPSGLLTVIQGRVGKKRVVAVLKLEKDEGVRATPLQLEGKNTFDLEQIRDLMMTGKTKVFKAGIFWQAGNTFDSIQGIISDKQRGSVGNNAVATFFLKSFLGCRLQEAPKLTTKKFFEASEKFINSEVDDPAKKAKYEISLLALMNNQEDTIRPKHFVEQNLEVRDRQRLIKYLDESDVPTDTFPKDVELIQNSLKQVCMKFSSGMVVLAPPHVIEERVRLEEAEDGSTHVEFSDQLSELRGKGKHSNKQARIAPDSESPTLPGK